MVNNSTIALPSGLIPTSRRPAVLADEVLVPASGSSMPDWLAYLQGRAAGFADAWANTTRYHADDYVHYNQNIYRAIVDTEGVQPGSDADGGNVWTMVLDARLGPPRGWLSTAEIDDRIVALRPNPYTTTDKNKLRDIESEATADQTADEIVDLLEALTGDGRLNYTSLRNLPTIPVERFRGNWAGGTTYGRGYIVWHDSHLWMCRANSLVSRTGPDGDTANWDPITVYRGDWNAGWFEPGDMVKDTYDGGVYVCIAAARHNHGRPSSDGSRWTIISNPFRGNWSGSGRYYRGNTVWHSNHLWICRTNNQQSQSGPDSDRDNWNPLSGYRGDWSAGWYEPGDVVRDTHDGQMYICRASALHTNGRPSSDASRWTLASNLFRGNWSNSARYQRGNIVWAANHLWVCRTDNLVSTSGPASDSANWDPLTLYRGAWASGWYEPGDMVTDSDDGQTYVCIASVVNTNGRPSGDATRWQRLSNQSIAEIVTALEALTGDDRLQYNALRGLPTIPRERYRGTWDTDATYEAGDVVAHSTQFYMSNSVTNADDPAPDAEDNVVWQRISSRSIGEIDGRITALRPNALTDTLLAKLNGVENGATADQTAAEIVTLLEALTGTDRLSYTALDGTPRERWRGNWSSGQTYQRADVVHHVGHLWFCLTDDRQSNAGPNRDPSNWDPLTLYRGDWSAGGYEPGDMVKDTADGQLYVCITSTGSDTGRPSTASGNWQRLSNHSASELDARIATWARANSPSGTAPPARLGTGTRDGSKYLRDDGAWADPTESHWLAPTLLGSHTVTLTKGAGALVESGTPAEQVDIPASGRVLITAYASNVVLGMTMAPASHLRRATAETPAARVLGHDGRSIAFYTDASNQLMAKSAIATGSYRVVVEHVADGSLPESGLPSAVDPVAIHVGYAAHDDALADIDFTADDEATFDGLPYDWTMANIPADTLVRPYWAVPSSQVQPEQWRQSGWELNRVIESLGDRTIDGVEYSFYAFVAANAVNDSYNGQVVAVS